MTNTTQHKSIDLGWLGEISPKYLVAAIAVITIGYFVQVNSPLRLNSDNSNLLVMADSYIQIGKFLVNGTESRFPTGYPYFIYGLSKIGASNPFGMIIANSILLGACIFFLAGIIKKQYPSIIGIHILIPLLTLMSFVIIKYAALPQSEMLFFTTSILALRCGIEIEGLWLRRLIFWFACATMSGISIWVRTVGICLIPIVFVGFYPLLTGRSISNIFNNLTLRSIILIGPVIATGVFGSIYLLISDNFYFYQFFDLSKTDASQISIHLLRKFTTIFQLFFNFPSRFINKVPLILTALAGGVIWAMIITGFWSLRKKLSIVEVYMATITTLLFIWPAFQPRFWMAVIPFLFLYGIIGGQKFFSPRLCHFLIKFWIFIFCALGITGLGYSISLSLDRDTFPSRYGNKVLTGIYRAAMDGTCPKGVNAVDFLAYQALMRFDPSMKPAKVKCKSDL